MCAVAAIPFIAMGASALIGAQQAQQQGAATAEANLQNAAFADAAASDAIKRGEFEADQSRIDTRAMIGAQRAGFAANGIDVNSGSAADVQDDTAALGEQDALTIKNNAAREAWGYRTQAQQNRMAASNARRSGQAGMFGSLLTAGAQGARAYGALRG
ncbi:hypothetical protein NJF44_01335 [Pseudomonas guariconensis]|uniref:virion core protein, T7 gp14 family n=1 Tax=Pseudomonas TaxID=286 RepID=UPI0020969B25|nr:MULTISPECIES: hypothetical protein [Pseudomonas]MCO7635228.1 hypothetical protein [Pseudomonas sp. S 311-6]MCO7513713.1 hypothetical protein [Pseudomonas putida]MCO7563572.1 hypothetical protein [Pseudomonas mosselii]MCO7603886.1 hypothetical protein [Pseudomonas guariconensis]MCO7616233.1 hypothetical protein [Pseudomonas guariconensis]